jgi:hypothetical protein
VGKLPLGREQHAAVFFEACSKGYLEARQGGRAPGRGGDFRDTILDGGGQVGGESGMWLYPGVLGETLWCQGQVLV